MNTPLDPWLLERLVCPLTRTPLVYGEAESELVSAAAGLAYPIRDGVPVMLVEEARVLSPGDLNQLSCLVESKNSAVL